MAPAPAARTDPSLAAKYYFHSGVSIECNEAYFVWEEPPSMKSRYVYKYTLMLLDGAILYGILTLFSVYRTELDFVTEYWYRAILPMVLTWIVL